MTEDTVCADLDYLSLALSNGVHSSAALESLHVRFAPMIMRLARRFAGDVDSREELKQEGHLALAEALPLFDTTRGARLSTFVYQRIRSRMHHWCRSQQRVLSLMNPNTRGCLCSLDEEINTSDEGSINLHEVVAADQDSPSHQAHLRMVWTTVQRSLSHLPERQAQAVRLLFWDDLSPSEIAMCLCVSRPRVTVLVQTGLANLRRELAVAA